MGGLDRLHVHKSLKASEENKAGALTGNSADSAEHPGGVVLDLLMLSADHHDGQHLAGNDHDAAKNGCLLRVEPLEKKTWDDTEKGEPVQHEIKPVENIIFDMVLLLDKIKVSIEQNRLNILNKTYIMR